MAGGGGGPVWCAVVLFTITTICICIYMCACVAWGLVGGPSELQRTSGGHRIKCALRNRSHCVYYNNNNNMVGRCVPVSCMPACLLPLWQQAGGGGGTARISTRPPLTAASQQDTPIHTHNTPCPAPNRAWRGAFEWRGVRLLFVLGISIISLCGRLSGRLKHCSKGSQMHTHTHTHIHTHGASRVVVVVV